MDLLSDVALLEATQLQKVLKRSKKDTHMLHVSFSDDGVGSPPKVLDELQDKTTGTNEGTSTIPRVPGVAKDQSESENESWGDSRDDDDDNDDDSNDDVNDDDSDDDANNVESDVNISLKDVEHANKEKGDVEMTNTETGDVELENVNQEGAGNQVKDDAQETQKTEDLIPSSSISSDYAAKYLNFDNIPLVDTEVVSMLDINVQHEVLRTSPCLTIQVSVIPEHTIVNPLEIVTTASITNLEKDVKELKTFDHSVALLSTIKSEVSNSVKEYLGISMDDALYKVLKKHDADIIKEHSVLAEIVEGL
ncbi:hypothetical protein Tco_0908522 [Tanacetum coccineum]|uniref:Uncharacterized protein n=1 Tax=Tanacetum coccineum TaxID=301880 RepID=A0ABQ5CQ71_9ASTR